MTATDELRRLLDDRGVEWDELSNEDGDRITRWKDANGRYVSALDFGETQFFADFYWGPTPQQVIDATLGVKVTGDTSDGYHTFNELYYHRAVLFSVIVHDHKELAWKSRHHHDGSMFDGMFIVGIDTPSGQATYHYDIDPYWDIFDCRELDYAPEWDGHSPSDAINRIATLRQEE